MVDKCDSQFLCRNYHKPYIIDSLIKEIQACEEDLQKAQESFTGLFFNTTASINSWALQLGELLGNNSVITLDCSKVDWLAPFEENLEIKQLQAKLSESLHKSKHSIKRSLLKCSNLVAQHTLMNMPHCELKYYNKQLRDLCVKECNESCELEKLTYSEALLDLQELCAVEDNVETQIRSFISSNSCGDSVEEIFSSEVETIEEFCGDYKDVSRPCDIG